LIQFRTLTLAISLAAVAFSTSVMAGDDMVYTYVNSSSGKAVTSSSGECVRTTRKDSTDKREVCGYAKPVQKSIEIVKAATAVSVTAKVDREVVIAAGVLFGFDNATLSEDGKLIIVERIARFGHEKNKVEVMVVGHTDSTGPEAYNQVLSERRAQNVATFIEQMKQSPDTSIEVSGMGESEPVASNDSREGRAANRRVVITAVGTVQE